MKGELIQLSKEEIKRLMIVQKIIDGILTINDASQILGLSSRQVKRLKKGVLELGFHSLAHGNRGRSPKHAIPENIKNEVISLAASIYQGFNFHHLRDTLASRHSIGLSVSSVRRILISAGINSPKTKRRPRVHRSRPRRARMGELVQIDASPFHWFGPSHPRLSLLAAIDDATGQVLAAVFRPQEDLIGYLMLLYQTITKYGIPQTVYSDRHTIFASPKREKLSIEEELAGLSAPLTNFGHCMAELGIYQAFAHSPQAKGRIERLWETLQDRLAKELALAGVDNIPAANEFLLDFLPRFNTQFSVEPENPVPAFSPPPEEEKLLLALSLRHKRKSDSGSVISFKNSRYQLVDDHGNVVCLKKGAPVTVLIDLYGRVRALYNDKVYNMVMLPTETHNATAPKEVKEKAEHKPVNRPAPDHPWERWNPDFLRSNNTRSPITYSRVTFSQNYYGDIFSER